MTIIILDTCLATMHGKKLSLTLLMRKSKFILFKIEIDYSSLLLKT